MTPWMPAPVMMPMRKSGTALATIIMRPSTSIMAVKSTRAKYAKWPKLLCRPTR
uniref:Uncharacterized protein n=1 Tax=Arundo donax TaxID=35708 RepID=A0A0A9BS39_ARUDO